MARTSDPPRGKCRLRMVCHTGIEPVRQLWEFCSGLGRSHRQENLRRCLLLGFLFPREGESEWTNSDPAGEIRTILIEILEDDPALQPVLEKHESILLPGERTGWVLRTCLAGYSILSRSSQGRGSERSGKRSSGEGIPPKKHSETAEKLLKGLLT